MKKLEKIYKKVIKNSLAKKILNFNVLELNKKRRKIRNENDFKKFNNDS